MIHIQEIQFSRPISERIRKPHQQPPHHRRSERIEQKHQTRPVRKPELQRIAARHPHSCSASPRRSPLRRIPARNSCQHRIQFDPLDLAKRQFGRQQHRPAHPGPGVYKHKLLNRRARPAPLPSPQQRAKNGRSHPEIRCGVPVIPMPRLQKSSRNNSARLYSVLLIKRVNRVAFPFRKPRQAGSLPLHALH